jgi:predicted transposase YdaD
MLGIELQHTRVYQDAKADGRTEEGQLLVLKQLTRKLGNISPEVRSKVNSLTIDKLESLGEDLLDFTSMADLEAWFSQNQR